LHGVLYPINSDLSSLPTRLAKEPYSSFENNEDIILEKINNFLVEAVQIISIGELISITNFLKAIDRYDKASEIIKKYFQKNRVKIESWDYMYLDEENINDEEVLNHIKSIISNVKKEIKLIDIVKNIFEHRGYDQEDKIILESVTEDEYFECFKLIHDDNLKGYIDTLWFFFKSNERISKNIKSALVKIATESKLNQFRLNGFKKLV